MQSSEAAKLEQAWRAKGSPPCDHPTLEVEFDLGGRTDDKVCTTCGEAFSREERRKRGWA